MTTAATKRRGGSPETDVTSRQRRNSGPKPVVPQAPIQPSNDNLEVTMGFFAKLVKLTKGLGKLRASIVIVASMGMMTVQSAHSLMNVAGIISIVIVSICAMMFAPKVDPSA